MLFITYWELNEDRSTEENIQAAQKLTSSGLFPPDKVKIIRWDGTPDGWGILVCEAESAGAMSDALNMWRAAGKGFFKVTKTAPAQPIEETIPQIAELLKRLASA
jgi:hypothetical protein